MKVLHILDHTRPIISGYSFRTHYILKWQKKLGAEPIGLSSPLYNSDQDKVFIDGVSYIRCGFPFDLGLFKKALSIFVLNKKIKELHKKYKFDIFHAHSPSILGLSTIKAQKRSKVPFVYEVRALWEDAAVDQNRIKEGSIGYRMYRGLESHVLKKANAVVVICEGLKKELISRGIDEKKIFVVPNGIDIEKFDPKKIKENSRLKKKFDIRSETVVGFIGSFYEFEGLDLLIRAVVKMDGVRVILVGDGEKFEDLKRLAHKLNKDKKVIFVGRVPHEEIFDYYSLMDILIYPRKKRRITDMVTPLKPLEAMALGKVVIGSDVKGIKEIIGEGHKAGGIIFAADDVEDLKKKIDMVRRDEALKAELRKKALLRAKQRAWHRIVQKYFDVYRFAKIDFQNKGNNSD